MANDACCHNTVPWEIWKVIGIMVLLVLIVSWGWVANEADLADFFQSQYQTALEARKTRQILERLRARSIADPRY